MTNKSRLHPSHDELVAFGLGKLDDDGHRQVEQHVENCGECCKVLLDLPSDTVVSLLRDSEADTSVSRDDPAKEPKQTGTVEHLPGAATTPLVDVPPDLRDHPRYRVIELLGRGGMGDVYKAEHRVMHRPLAVKVINRELIRNPTAVERFRREAQTAARLDHPNIVTAYDAEQAGDLHLLAMEFVEGTDLAEVVQQRGPLPIDEACRYIQQIAEGLQHAYKAGMIHRDIKPQNLMLTADGRIKILDFGLAGLIVDAILVDEDPSGAGNSSESPPRSLTAVGSMMGTPDYVAPEQARDARSADIRADIYSLGCTLYFLLTGRPPFPDGSVMDKVRSHQQHQPPPISQMRDDLPPRLEQVLAKTMSKDPAARYRRPADVVEALRPFAEGILPGELADPFAPPRRTIWPRVRTIAEITALLALGAVIWIVSDRGRIKIESDVDDVQVVVTQDGRDVKIIDLQTDSTVRWLPSGGYDVRLRSDRNDVKLSLDRITITRWGKQIVSATRVEPSRRTESSGPRSVGDVAVIEKPRLRLTGHTAIVRGLDISPDGRRLISASWDGSSRMWDLQTGEMVHLFHHEPRVNDARFAPAGRRVIVAENTIVRVYDAETYERLPLQFEHPKPLTKLEFSQSGRQLLTGCLDATMRLWDLQTGELLKTYGGHTKSLEAVLFTASGAEVLSGSLDTTVRRFNTESGRLQAWYPHPDMVLSMCSSPEGRVVYVGCGKGVIFAWDFQTGQIVKQFRGHQGEVLRLATHERMLVSAGSDRTARVWDVATGQEVARLVDHQDRIDAVAISPDGRRIVTGGGFHPVSDATWERPDYAIRVWDLTPAMLPGPTPTKPLAEKAGPGTN